MIRKVPGKLIWEFTNLPPDKHALLENFAIRLGNNLAAKINEKLEEFVEFTHDLHPMSEGERKFRIQQRGGELYKFCTTCALEELNTPGTPFKAILSEMDSQE